MRCLFCDNMRLKGLVVCDKCKPYLVYKHEPWFAALLKMDKIQQSIDSREIPFLSYVRNTSQSFMEMSYRKPSGPIPKLDFNLRKLVNEWHDNGIPIRTIKSNLEKIGVIVSRETVRRALR